MGHFGRPPISRAWFFVVFPALTLNYLGQGSLILGDPSAISNPFFLLIPHWGRVPMVVLATVATVIASQAVISGAFSVTQPGGPARLPAAAARSATPRPRRSARSTCRRSTGSCSIAVVALVLGFGSSTRLGLRLRDRGHRHDHRRHPALPGDRPDALEETGLAGRDRRRRLLHRRPRLPRRQPDQDRARRLVPALGRHRRSSPCSAPGGAAARRSANRGSRRRARCRPSSTSCARPTRRRRGCRARRSTSTPAAKRRRSPCAPASSTPTRCTSRS